MQMIDDIVPCDEGRYATTRKFSVIVLVANPVQKVERNKQGMDECEYRLLPHSEIKRLIERQFRDLAVDV